MRFLVDRGASIQVMDWFKGRGYDAVHLRNSGMHTAPDDRISRRHLQRIVFL